MEGAPHGPLQLYGAFRPCASCGPVTLATSECLRLQRRKRWREPGAYGFRSGEQALAGWLHSPSHRANLERASWTLTGIGVAVSSDGTYLWAESFGSGP
ncbi:MAG: CAP domain-containing protein [Gaiellaceae bacterium]